MIRGDVSLKSKVKVMAKKSNLKPRSSCRYICSSPSDVAREERLRRVPRLKGGLLISSMTGFFRG